MLTKAITYTDYNGNKKTKNFYFNLTKSELTKMELSSKAGLKETIKAMINENDRAKIVEMFEGLVLGSIGEKSADGERFEKSEEITNAFKQHPAYDILFMELISSDKAMADFINAIVPAEVSEAAKENKRTINDIMGYEVIPETEDKPEIKPVK